MLARFFMEDPAVFHHTLGELRAFAQNHPATRIVPSHCAETLGELRAVVPAESAKDGSP